MLALPGVVRAQSGTRPNSGALTFTGGLDAPSVFVFRGIVQEAEPKLTLSPYGDIGLALKSGDGTLKRVGLNVGVWSSLQTGSSGSNGFTEHLHYRQNFYATLSFGLAKGLSVGTTYTAYTSPNLMFDTVKEASLTVAQSGRFKPYALVAFELGEHGADSGVNKGTYVELGVGPSLSLGRATLTIPVKVGLSGKDYYERNGVDQAFGYVEGGAVVTLPLAFVSPSFGAWNIHGGVSVLSLGDTTKAFNAGENSKVVGQIGVGLKY